MILRFGLFILKPYQVAKKVQYNGMYLVNVANVPRSSNKNHTHTPTKLLRVAHMKVSTHINNQNKQQ